MLLRAHSEFFTCMRSQRRLQVNSTNAGTHVLLDTDVLPMTPTAVSSHTQFYSKRAILPHELYEPCVPAGSTFVDAWWALGGIMMYSTIHGYGSPMTRRDGTKDEDF